MRYIFLKFNFFGGQNRILQFGGDKESIRWPEYVEESYMNLYLAKTLSKIFFERINSPTVSLKGRRKCKRLCNWRILKVSYLPRFFEFFYALKKFYYKFSDLFHPLTMKFEA